MTTPSRDVLVVFSVATLLAIPFLVCRFPIGQDLPAHVETAAQMVSIWRGDGGIGAHYQLRGWPWPNSLPTVLLALLSVVVDGLVGAKLLTALALVMWPVSIAVLLERLGRSALFALVIMPTAHDLAFAYGFFHFVVAKPLWIMAIVIAIDVGRRPSKGRGAALVATLVALFSCHLLLFLSALPLCVIASGLCAFVSPSTSSSSISSSSRWTSRSRGLGAGLGVVALSALPFLWWYQRSAQRPDPKADVYVPLSEGLDAFWGNLGDLSGKGSDAWPWLMGGVVLVIGGAFSIARRRHVTRVVCAEGAALPLILGLCVCGFALFGPIKTASASVVAERFSALGIALVACALVPRVRVGGAARAALLVSGITIALSMVVPTAQRWRAFNAEQMGDFDELVDEVPRGAVVATHFVWALSPHGRFNVLWHWPKLVARRGAVTDDSFAFRDTCVVGIASGGTPPRRRPFPPGRHLRAEDLKGFDHLLVQGRDRRFGYAEKKGLLQMVKQTGVWTLYRIVVQASPTDVTMKEHDGRP
jgi:hypothetical protein